MKPPIEIAQELGYQTLFLYDENDLKLPETNKKELMYFNIWLKLTYRFRIFIVPITNSWLYLLIHDNSNVAYQSEEYGQETDCITAAMSEAMEIVKAMK